MKLDTVAQCCVNSKKILECRHGLAIQQASRPVDTDQQIIIFGAQEY